MNNPENRPLLGELRDTVAALGDQLRDGLAARCELARLELESDIRAVKRLAVWWLVAMTALLTALPLLAAAGAEMLDGCWGIARVGWLAIIACGLLLAALLGGRLAWRRFRRCFIGLQETREELREDLLWLREKTTSIESD